MKNRVSIGFLLPSLAIYMLVKVYPMLQAIFYSLTNYNGLTKDFRFVGIENFVKLFSDERFINSIKVTVLFVIIVVVVVNVLGLFLAVLLNRSSAVVNFMRSVFFLPVVLSQVAIAYIWKTIYAYDGILDFILKKFHLSAIKQQWVSDPDIALFSVAATEIWRIMGYHMIIILSALQTIPEDLYEAASIDGCGPWKKFRHVTLPLVMPGLSVSVMMSTMGAMKQFDIVKVLTDGGPMGATDTISYSIIDYAFNYNMQGYASAIGVILFTGILCITMIQNGLFKRKEVDY